MSENPEFSKRVTAPRVAAWPPRPPAVAAGRSRRGATTPLTPCLLRSVKPGCARRRGPFHMVFRPAGCAAVDPPQRTSAAGPRHAARLRGMPQGCAGAARGRRAGVRLRRVKPPREGARMDSCQYARSLSRRRALLQPASRHRISSVTVSAALDRQSDPRVSSVPLVLRTPIFFCAPSAPSARKTPAAGRKSAVFWVSPLFLSRRRRENRPQLPVLCGARLFCGLIPLFCGF